MNKLTLPFPPSANRYWRHARNMIYVSKEAQDYRDVVFGCFIEQFPDVSLPMIVDRPVSLHIVAYMPSTERDLENSTKVLFDALQNVLYVDDIQVHHYEVTRHEAMPPKRKNARVEIEFGVYYP